MNDETIEKSLGTMPAPPPPVEAEVVDYVPAVVEPQEPTDEVTENYDAVKDSLTGTIAAGHEALQEMLILAKQFESPRAFEVVGALMKSITDANKELIDTTKKVRDMRAEDGQQQGGPTEVHNNLFVGSTSELLDMIEQKKNDAEKVDDVSGE